MWTAYRSVVCMVCMVASMVCKYTYTLDVVAHVELLVLRVRHVVAGAHGQQQHVLVAGLLQRDSHRDGAALAGHVGLRLRTRFHIRHELL